MTYTVFFLLSSIIEIWFNWLTETTDLSFLMNFCRNPFPEIKFSALLLLKTICAAKWGQRSLAETGGFIELLLDRSVEFDKESLHAKYEIIKLLADSTVFDAMTLLQFKKYVEQGAFYVQGIMDVAVE